MSSEMGVANKITLINCIITYNCYFSFLKYYFQKLKKHLKESNLNKMMRISCAHSICIFEFAKNCSERSSTPFSARNRVESAICFGFIDKLFIDENNILKIELNVNSERETCGKKDKPRQFIHGNLCFSCENVTRQAVKFLDKINTIIMNEP